MTGVALATLSGALLSLFLFPWPLTAALALSTALFVPAAPLALGLAADALYWSPSLHAIPFATIAGAFASALALLVRSRLLPGIIAP